MFGSDRVLVLDSVALKARPEETVREATDFLGIEPVSGVEYAEYNKRDSGVVSPALRTRYGPIFEASNERLRQLIPGRGKNPGVTRAPSSDANATTPVAGSWR